MAMVVPLVLGWTLDLISGLPKSVRQRQRSCLYGRDLRSLWQTDFATPRHWIPAQSTPPNRCALWRGPRKAGMTQNIAWWTCFGGTFPPSKILSILSSAFYSTFPRPHRSTYIYGGRICNIWLAGGLPAVILNPVRDDLRMMAPKPVAARDGAMKGKRDNWYFILFDASMAGRNLQRNRDGGRQVFPSLFSDAFRPCLLCGAALCACHPASHLPALR
jgi:hypothetical protein